MKEPWPALFCLALWFLEPIFAKIKYLMDIKKKNNKLGIIVLPGFFIVVKYIQERCHLNYFLSVQLSDINYIHIIVQLSPLYFQNFLITLNSIPTMY